MGLQIINDFMLQWDEEAARERAGFVVLDEDIRLLMRENRIALARETCERVTFSGSDLLDITLRCVAHPHPKCKILNVRLVVDLSSPKGMRIRDMSPVEIKGSEPVKLTTSRSASFALEVKQSPVTLKPGLASARSSEHNVYFPEIVASGRGLSKAIWDFRETPQYPLHLDRDLRLLVELPKELDQVYAGFRLSGEIRAADLNVPFVNKRPEKAGMFRLTQ